jgi:CRISPR-associated protein Cas2
LTLIVVAYDVNTELIEGRRRLRRVAACCEDYGQRVQNSVFECFVDASQWAKLRRRLLDEVDLKTDSLRFYFLGKNWKNHVEHAGAKPSYDPSGPLIL